uniref:NADH-ubiquinone oxidoreductase chain 3 n=1 Tax=Acizzia uncatoides TaxID=121830 RepID=A0A344A224_ACIUN|nr:NADH dehydrogenase subunit 3 [Acizzia uncatoides]AWU48815.1 NADH dehydrogenase subunit 3 [Acizzia uncatoides]
MFIVLFSLILLMILTLAINIIPLINIHKKMDREKASPFECGFDPFSKPRIAFSIHFFCISLMFLVFDIEITLILPLPMVSSEMLLINWISSSLTLFSILITGLFMEWKEGSMNWL